MGCSCPEGVRPLMGGDPTGRAAQWSSGGAPSTARELGAAHVDGPGHNLVAVAPSNLTKDYF